MSNSLYVATIETEEPAKHKCKVPEWYAEGDITRCDFPRGSLFVCGECSSVYKYIANFWLYGWKSVRPKAAKKLLEASNLSKYKEASHYG